MNGVMNHDYELLRVGNCNFQHDGAYNPETEILVYNAPECPCIKDGVNIEWHKYVNSEWVLVNE